MLQEDAVVRRGVLSRVDVGVGLVFAAVTAVVVVLTREVFDDPWILYRYAENLSAGDGWVFDPGSQTDNAVTSPLMVLLLAAGITVGVPVATVSAAIFGLGTWGAAFFSYAALARVKNEAAGVSAGLLLILAPPLLQLRGMETSLYLALIAAATFCYLTDRRAALGAVLGLAVIARPDAAIFAACVVAWLLYASRRIPWATLVSAVAVLVPWVISSVLLTGGVVPSTLAAKIAQRESGRWTGYVYGLAHLPLEPGMRLWFLLAGVLAVIGVVVALRERLISLLPVAAFAVLFVAAYGFVLDVAFYRWYAAVPVYALILAAGIGAGAVWSAVPRRAQIGAAVVLAAAAVAAGAQSPPMDAARVQYQDVGNWLRQNTDPGDTVAAAEIGRLAYFSDRTFVDYLGLLDSEAVPHVRDADWTWWVDAYQPDYWVTFNPAAGGNWVVDRSVREEQGFATLYRPVYETDELIVYRRVG